MIYVGENKSVLCKGDFHPAELYKGDTKIAGYTLTDFEGENGVTLTDCYNDKIYDVQLNGKNLLDVNKWYSDWANENGGMTIQSGQLYNISDYKIKVMGIFKGNTRYTFSCKYNLAEATTFLQPQIKYTDGTQSYIRMGTAGYGVGEGTITITSVGEKTVEYFGFTYGTNIDTRFECELTEMQIEEGTSATEYEEPCRDATVTARGKNLFNIYAEREVLKGSLPNDSYEVKDGVMSFKSSYYDASLNVFGIKVNVKKNTTYYFKYKTLTGRPYSTVYNSSGAVMTARNGYDGFSFEVGDSEDIYISIRSNGWDLYTELTDMMIVEDSDDTIYEPYIELQTILFENGLLAADIPTFKGTTVIELESDIAATISGKYKKIGV